MHSNAFHRLNLAAAVAIGVTGIGFLAFRAAQLSFTHDEALTYLHAIRPGIARLLAFDYPNANNHLLNSLFGWIAYRSLGASFGASEWALRLPNVIAFAVFLAAAYRLLARRVRPALVVPGLLLIVCNPFQLDFFALCRGYGLALAFTGLALAAALASLEDSNDRPLAARRRDAVKAGWYAAAATLANLAWLNFALALVLVSAALQLVRARQDPGAGGFARTWLLPQLPTAAALVAILVPVVLRLRGEQALYLGGGSGYWNDTVGSLIASSLYAQPYSDALREPLTIAIAALGVATFAIAFAGARRAIPGSSREGALAMVGILVVCVASSELQHQLFGTNFLIDRTALFLAPVFALLVIFCCDTLDASAVLHRIGGSTAGAFAVVAAVHTLLALNVSHTLEWAYDADTRRMLRDLGDIVEDEDGAAPARPRRLGAEWLHQPAIDYYRERDRLDWLAPMTRRGFAGTHDFYFHRREPADPAVERVPMQALKHYPVSDHVLARGVE